MVGNVALDVVIGLVFVYLLYSLYATIIMEIISSAFGLRARNLSYALRRMLMDEKKYKNSFLFILSQVVTSLIQVSGKSINLKNKALYDKFFDQPTIRYLGSGGLSNKPSYIKPDDFTKSIIDAIKIDDPDMSLLACIEAGLENLPPDSETRKHVQSLLDDANNDLAKFKILLHNWYLNTMERSVGWFKRSTQIILIVIGFILAVSFNADTISIIKKLSKDENARDQLVKLAIDFNEDNTSILEALKNSKDTALTDLSKRFDSLQNIRSSLEREIQNSKNVLATDWNLPDSLEYYTSSQKPVHNDSMEVVHTLRSGENVFMIVHKAIDPTVLKKVVRHKPEAGERWLHVDTFRYKLNYVFNADHIWGYLLTMLALTLGAPFWFDLLNKIIKLKTSKSTSTDADQKPDSSSSSSSSATLNRAG